MGLCSCSLAGTARLLRGGLVGRPNHREGGLIQLSFQVDRGRRRTAAQDDPAGQARESRLSHRAARGNHSVLANGERAGDPEYVAVQADAEAAQLQSRVARQVRRGVQGVH